MTTWDIVLSRQGLVIQSAKRCQERFPTNDLELGDYISMAMVAAYEAVESWREPRGGMTFEAYLCTRIEHRVLDQLRKFWKTKGWSRTKGQQYTTISYEMNEDDANILDLAGSEEVNSYVEWEEVSSLLVRLNERERYVTAQLLAGRKLSDIGRSLGVSESRVCQIRKVIREKVEAVKVV